MNLHVTNMLLVAALAWQTAAPWAAAQEGTVAAAAQPAAGQENDPAVDERSFWGHPYTCDGKQVPDLPSLCAPQQTLFTIDDDNELTFISDWIDTVALFESAFAE